jgi:hypothetical protein
VTSRIPRAWIRNLALHAVQDVLKERATGLAEVLLWTDDELKKVRPKGKIAKRLLYKALGRRTL